MRSVTRGILVALLVILPGVAPAAEETIERPASAEVRGELEAELGRLDRSRWLFLGSLGAGLLLPPAAPFLVPTGTLLSASVALDAGQEYRRSLEAALGEDPLPPLDRPRAAMVTGVLAYVVAELALGYTIFAALATIDDPDDFWERQVQIGGGVSITAFVLGVGATGFATWNTHRRTVGRQRDG